MIELTRPPVSTESDEIAATLLDMVVAFRVVEDPAADGPVLRDGPLVASSADDISGFLDRLRRDLRLWNAFQSDACFIEDDGTIC
jgi:hypothetical protein